MPQSYSVSLRSGRVVLWGRPNVGKSSLLNGLLAQPIAVVSPKPQTTRQRIVGVCNRDDCQIEIVDTPGQLRPRHHLDKFMVRSAQRSLEDADVVVLVVDGSVPPGELDELAADSLARVQAPVILALNKMDACAEGGSRFRDLYELLGSFAATVEISAELGFNLEELVDEIRPHLRERSPRFPREIQARQPDPVDVAELIRERLLHFLRQEIPHACAVVVERLVNCPDGLLKIEATIHVEKNSQKVIVIGQGGRMIREIGTGARKLLEQLYGRKVYLGLQVRVTPMWRHSPGSVRRLGYQLDEH